MSVVFEIKDGQTFTEVMNSSYDVIIIDIYADWCGPCKYLAPKLEELAKQYSSPNILFCKLNTETGIKQDVKGLPTIEFWVKAQNGQKQLYHTVLGADFPDIQKTVANLVGAPPQERQQEGSIPEPKAGFKNKSGSGRDRQYKTYRTYA